MISKRPWWQDGIIYQIYPRSFMDSNRDGIGDIIGITQKLDYLEFLGIDAIWLSPIFPSPDVDFGYDVSNYRDIDPKFGDMLIFEKFLEQAHKKNIKIILDLVLNHTSDQHPWFLESKSSKNNPKRDWYIWKDASKSGGRPNNWQAVFGGPAWEFDPVTEQYYYHMFYKEQPDLNWRNPDVREELMGVFRFWLEKGVDGFRLDVFNAYFKDAAFRNNPPALGIRGFDRQQHIYDHSQPEMADVLKEIRAILDGYPERYAVGETFLNDNLAVQYCGEGKLHATFNFDLLKQRWNPQNMFAAVQNWQQSLGDKAWPTLVFNNHDEPRSSSRWKVGSNDDRLKIAAAYLLTQKGTPFLYYGEEIGMRDIPIWKKSEIQDPIGKRYWPFFVGRDGCRSPMQWDDRENASFSEGSPWLPVHQQYPQRNVEQQKNDPDSLFNFYRRLIQIRRQSRALREGMVTSLTYDTRLIMAYLRQIGEEMIIVTLNFSSWRAVNFFLGKELAQKSWQVLLSNRRSEGQIEKSEKIRLSPYEVTIFTRFVE